MNRKGYTLIELLAVIVIIALIGGIGAVAYNAIQSQVVERVFSSYMDDMHESMIMYLIEHPSMKPTSSNPTKKVYLEDLKIAGLNNPINSNDKCSGSYVEAKFIDKNTEMENNGQKGITGISYHVVLNCTDKIREKDYTN